MQSVLDILQAEGYESPAEMEVGDYIEVEPDDTGTMMPLVIEKIDANRVSVAHYYTQMGDVMYDPEIVFDILESGSWIAVEYTQHPHIYQRDEGGLIDAQDFAVNTWDKNLRQQGYVAAAGGER